MMVPFVIITWTNLKYNIFSGTLLIMVVCLYNQRHMNNVMQFHSAITVLATACILCYRVATLTLYFPIEEVSTWDSVVIVNVLLGLIMAQLIFEVLSYTGIFKIFAPTLNYDNQFVYNKPKAKTEDYHYEPIVQEPGNLEVVKLNLVKSLSHLMLNHLMLVIALLMRPHNVIMIPSIYFTCVLTSKCMDHKLLDSKPGRRTEIADTLSRTLVHLWIGYLFFFYQVSWNLRILTPYLPRFVKGDLICSKLSHVPCPKMSSFGDLNIEVFKKNSRFKQINLYLENNLFFLFYCIWLVYILFY